MTDVVKPKLLFLRFARQELPAFIRLHLQEQVRCLSQFFDVTIIDQPCDYRQLCELHEPDICIFESGAYVGRREIINISAFAEIPKLGFIHCDAYCPSRVYAISDMARWEVTNFFAISVSLPSYTPTIADDLFIWPNFVDTDVYYNYELPKVIPVLFTGSQANHYPWRNRISRIIAQYYPTLQCPHFGWDLVGPTEKMMHGKAYARLINASLVAPACGTIAKDIVRKHFEIPACNTCLITEPTPALEAAGFVDMVNCVFADDTNVIDKLDWLFRNQDELEQITRAGWQLIQHRHTMRHRDQVYQWFELNKMLRPGQRIVQPSPFLPLTIAEKGNGITNRHISSDGVDRRLIAQGDELLWSGQYDEATVLFRKCLNFQPIPEARLRLSLCDLFSGRAGHARELLAEPIERGFRSGSEPDPVEWAYFVVSILCQGRLIEAVSRAHEFPEMGHEELDNVRAAVSALSVDARQVTTVRAHSVYRRSIHQLPKRTTDEWLWDLGKMLRAAGHERLAKQVMDSSTVFVGRLNLAGISSRIHAPGGHHSRTTWGIDQYAQAARYNSVSGRLLGCGKDIGKRIKSLLKHLVLPTLWAVESRTGSFLPHKWSLISNCENTLRISSLLRSEKFSYGLILGAASRAWLTEAFIKGMEESPLLPKAVFVNCNTTRFLKLRKRLSKNDRARCYELSDLYGACEGACEIERTHFDIVVIDCSQIEVASALHYVPDAELIVLNDINGELGFKLFQALLSNPRYSFITSEPTNEVEYAVFRRLILTQNMVNGDPCFYIERKKTPREINFDCEEM